MQITTKLEDRALRRKLQQINRSAVPRVNARSINKMASKIKTDTVRDTSRNLPGGPIPQKFIRNRYNKLGQKKADRIKYIKANRAKQYADLITYVRGLPVYQVAKKPLGATKRLSATTRQRRQGGVKAAGGRFYKDAFYATGRGGVKQMVFKRRGDNKLMVPKIGIRDHVERFNRRAKRKPEYRNIFNREWVRLAELEIQKAGLKTNRFR